MFAVTLLALMAGQESVGVTKLRCFQRCRRAGKLLEYSHVAVLIPNSVAQKYNSTLVFSVWVTLFELAALLDAELVKGSNVDLLPVSVGLSANCPPRLDLADVPTGLSFQLRPLLFARCVRRGRHRNFVLTNGASDECLKFQVFVQ